MRNLSIQETSSVAGGQDTVTVTGEFASGSFGSGAISVDEVAHNMYTTYVDTFDDEESAGLQALGLVSLIDLMLDTPLDEIGDPLMVPLTAIPAGTIIGSVSLDSDYFAELLLMGDADTGEMFMYIDSDNNNTWDRRIQVR